MVARTKKYCAPEVYSWGSRGRAADVFSLGCVFLGMETVIRGETLDDFADFRSRKNSCHHCNEAGDDEYCGGEDDSFHGNLERVYEWIKLLTCIDAPTNLNPVLFTEVSDAARLHLIRSMLYEKQEERPRAQDVVESLGGHRACCRSTREPYTMEPRRAGEENGLSSAAAGDYSAGLA